MQTKCGVARAEAPTANATILLHFYYHHLRFDHLSEFPEERDVMILIDPCTLITLAEAAAVLGGPVDEVQHEMHLSAGDEAIVGCCTFVTTAGFPVKGISVLTYQAPAAEATALAFARSKATASAEVQPLPDLGQDAYWESRLGRLHVLQGNLWLIISSDSVEGFNSAEAARVLALQALQRLKIIPNR